MVVNNGETFNYIHIEKNSESALLWEIWMFQCLSKSLFFLFVFFCLFFLRLICAAVRTRVEQRPVLITPFKAQCVLWPRSVGSLKCSLCGFMSPGGVWYTDATIVTWNSSELLKIVLPYLSGEWVVLLHCRCTTCIQEQMVWCTLYWASNWGNHWALTNAREFLTS